MQRARHHMPRERAPQRRVVVGLAIHAHPCASCGTPTSRPWFCVDCEARARPHVEDDPYDDLGGESSDAQ